MCDHCGCRAFPPIAELTAEHEEILRLAWNLAETEPAGREPASGAALLELLDVHVTREETGLYRELISGGALSADEVTDLEEEHRELRASIEGGRFDRRDFYALAAHIEVEEMELFPAAMLGFDEDEWDAVEGAHRAADVPTTAPS